MISGLYTLSPVLYLIYLFAGSAMAETHDVAVPGSSARPPALGAVHEERLGRIVIEMLRAGLPVSRKTLFLKIAFLMNQTDAPAEALLYEGIFRLLLNADREH